MSQGSLHAAAKLNSTLTFVCAVVLFVLVPGISFAQLMITDCNGFTRALHRVDPGSLNNVDITVSDALGNPAEGVEVTLTNSATGETVTAVSQNGVASFNNLAAGSFSMSSPAAGATVGAVSVAPVGVGTATAVGVVGTSAAAAGGGAVGVGEVTGIDIVDEITNNEPDPTPTPTPTPAPTPEPTPEATPIPTPRPTATPPQATPRPTPRPRPTATPTPCDCDPDATPSPLPPFAPTIVTPTPISPSI